WFIGLWSVCVYCPIAHFVWGPDGFLNEAGVLDFAGGTVVHINSGFAGLMAALVMGRRRGYATEPMPPHNLVLSVIGASLLWVGWFGFNAGSATAANGNAGMAMAANPDRDRRRRARVDVCRMGHEGKAERAWDHLRSSGGAGGDYPGLRVCRTARRVDNPPGRRRHPVMGYD